MLFITGYIVFIGIILGVGFLLQIGDRRGKDGNDDGNDSVV